MKVRTGGSPTVTITGKRDSFTVLQSKLEQDSDKTKHLASALPSSQPHFTLSLPAPLLPPSVMQGDREWGLCSVLYALFCCSFTLMPFPAPAWGPSHRRQSFGNRLLQLGFSVATVPAPAWALHGVTASGTSTCSSFSLLQPEATFGKSESALWKTRK